jgi:hypothetical protein
MTSLKQIVESTFDALHGITDALAPHLIPELRDLALQYVTTELLLFEDIFLKAIDAPLPSQASLHCKRPPRGSNAICAQLQRAYLGKY